jgi:hypothetical protein
MIHGQQSLSYVQAPASEVTSTLTVSSVVANGIGNINSPVSAFEQASDSIKFAVIPMEYFSAQPLKKLRIRIL